MIPYIKKSTDGAGNEWVDAQDIFNYVEEGSPFFNKWYMFIVKQCEVLNYFNMNTSTAYGNPDYSNMLGFCSGYLTALHCYSWDKDGVMIIKDKNDKNIFKIDVPKTSSLEKENREELRKLWNNLF